MKPKYDSYEEYVINHLGFGDGDSIISVELINRSVNKYQNLYYSANKTEEELSKSIAICEAIIDSGRVSGDLRIYVDYNYSLLTRGVISEITKSYVTLLTNTTTDISPRSLLSIPKSELLKFRQRNAFLLDVDSQSIIVVNKLEAILERLNVEVLLVTTTKKGFHYVVAKCDSDKLNNQLTGADLRYLVTLMKTDGYLMYERDNIKSSLTESDEHRESGI